MKKRRRIAVPISLNTKDGEPDVGVLPQENSDSDDFVLVPETSTEGWCLGSNTNFEIPEGCDGGLVVVIAPNGSRAALLWEVGSEPLEEILPPDEKGWGFYSVSFPHPTRTVEDLVSAFRAVLPQLKAKYAEISHAV
jgi:hypothetical protein